MGVVTAIAISAASGVSRAHGATPERSAAGVVTYTVAPRARGCPTEAGFLAEVGRQLGEVGSLDRYGEGRRLEVTVEVLGDGSLVTRITASVDEDGLPRDERRQELHGPANACMDLTSAAAIAVSLVLREPRAPPDLPAASDDRERPPPSTPPPPPARPAEEHPVPANAPSASAPPPRLAHAMFAGLVAGRLVRPSVGVGATVGWVGTYRTRWAGIVEATMTAPGTAQGRRGAEVRVVTRTFTLSPCVNVGPAFGCAYASFGSTVGHGSGAIAAPASAVFFQTELGARLGARIPLVGPFRLRLDLRAGAPLVRPEFSVGGDTVWRAPAVTVAGCGALETNF